jgi:hypothetical protein
MSAIQTLAGNEPGTFRLIDAMPERASKNVKPWTPERTAEWLMEPIPK